jgi:hypothetical protein
VLVHPLENKELIDLLRAQGYGIIFDETVKLHVENPDGLQIIEEKYLKIGDYRCL